MEVIAPISHCHNNNTARHQTRRPTTEQHQFLPFMLVNQLGFGWPRSRTSPGCELGAGLTTFPILLGLRANCDGVFPWWWQKDRKADATTWACYKPQLASCLQQVMATWVNSRAKSQGIGGILSTHHRVMARCEHLIPPCHGGVKNHDSI